MTEQQEEYNKAVKIVQDILFSKSIISLKKHKFTWDELVYIYLTGKGHGVELARSIYNDTVKGGEQK